MLSQVYVRKLQKIKKNIKISYYKQCYYSDKTHNLKKLIGIVYLLYQGFGIKKRNGYKKSNKVGNNLKL